MPRQDAEVTMVTAQAQAQAQVQAQAQAQASGVRRRTMVLSLAALAPVVAGGLGAACAPAGGGAETAVKTGRPARVVVRVGASPTLTSFFEGTLLPGYKQKA